MKMIYCTYNVSVTDDLQKILQELEIENYQVFENILAKTSGSVPRLNTPVWPGMNNSVLIQLPETSDLQERIQQYNQKTRDDSEKIFCYQWEVEPLN
ncbi:MAG: PG0541 family transporter-associated protein [Fidelibacterota bacterium]